MFAKYVGSTIEIIYMDKRGNFSKRTVDVRSVRDGRAHVYCHKAEAPRMLLIDNIMGPRLVQDAG